MVKVFETSRCGCVLTVRKSKKRCAYCAFSSFTNAINGDGKGGGGLFQKLDKVITENSAKVTATMTNLQEITTKLNNGEGTLGRLINDDSLFRDAQSAIKKADRALDGLNDSGPISAVGTVAGSLF